MKLWDVGGLPEPHAHIDGDAALVSLHTITPEAKRNRGLLRQVTAEAGFKPLRTEWWHSNLVSQAEPKTHCKTAKQETSHVWSAN